MLFDHTGTDPCVNKNQNGVQANWGALHANFSIKIDALGLLGPFETKKVKFYS